MLFNLNFRVYYKSLILNLFFVYSINFFKYSKNFSKLYQEYLSNKLALINPDIENIYMAKTLRSVHDLGSAIFRKHLSFKLIALNESLSLNCVLNTSNVFSKRMYVHKLITQRSTVEILNNSECTLVTKESTARSYFLFHSARVSYLVNAVQYNLLLCEMLSKRSVKVNDSSLPYTSNLNKKIINNRSVDLICSSKIIEIISLHYLSNLCILCLDYGYKHIVNLNSHDPVAIQTQLCILQKSIQKEIYPYTLKDLYNNNNDDFI